MGNFDDLTTQFFDTSSVEPEQLNQLEKSLLVYAMDNLVFASSLSHILKPEDFSVPEHQKVFAKIQDIVKSEPKSYGLVYVNLELSDNGVNIDIDEYAKYSKEIRSDSVAYQVAQKIQEYSLRSLLVKKLASASIDLQTASIEEALGRLRDIELEVTSRLVGSSDEYDIDSLINEFNEFIYSPDKPITYKLGIQEIDSILPDFTRSNLVIIGARPSVGKTALMVRSAYENAVDGRKVHIFSYEMSRRQITARFVSIPAKTLPSHLLTKRFVPSNLLMRNYTSVFDNMPLRISTPKSGTIGRLLQGIRESVIRYGTELVYIDYLQLVKVPGAKSRREEVGTISRELTRLANELNICIVALAQLKRHDKDEPVMDDLKESGDIEQDASLILMMYKSKEDEESNTTSGGEKYVNIKIEKQRNGEAGRRFKLKLNPAGMRFSTITTNEDMPNESK